MGLFQWSRKPIELILPAGVKHFPSLSSMGSDRVQRLEELAYQHGLYSDSYLALQHDREYLWSSNDRAVVGFSRVGRFLHVGGGVLGADREKQHMIGEIVRFAQLNRMTITLFHINTDEPPLYRDQSFQVTKFGVEARIPLMNHTWHGKRFEWVRRQSNYVQREGIRFEEWNFGQSDFSLDAVRISELEQVSESHFSRMTQKESIPLFEGTLPRDGFCRRRVFVAGGGTSPGRIEGFVVCNPIEGGRSWAVEMYRKRTDAVRGTIPYLIQQTVDQLRSEGCEEVSICPTPAIGCEQKLEGDSYIVRTALNLWRRFGYPVYDIHGLFHFKSRFRPEFRDVFICAYPNFSLAGTLAYLKLVGVMNVKAGTLLHKLINWSSQRRTLADPRVEPALQTNAGRDSRAA